MIRVLLETTWVVGYAAPEHRQLPAARALFARAERGELKLYLPSICLTQARRTIRHRYQPRQEADAIRTYLARALEGGRVSEQEDRATRRVLDLFEAQVRTEINALDETFAALRSWPEVIEVFALDDEMLALSVELAGSALELEHFDHAILAAILVRARRLAGEGEQEIAFCGTDGDLLPWNKQGAAKQPLTRLYDDARVWVYGDFDLVAPARPAAWPRTPGGTAL